MLTTKRGYIIEDLRSTIEDLSIITTAQADSNQAIHTVEPDQLPYVHITQASANYVPEKSSLGGFEMWEVKLVATIITQDDNIEEIRGEIKEGIAVNPTRSGHAKLTTYTGDKPFIGADIPSGTQILEMDITCTYIVEEGKKT